MDRIEVTLGVEMDVDVDAVDDALALLEAAVTRVPSVVSVEIDDWDVI